MRSNKPYLVRAFYEWIADNNCTPFVAVDAMYPGCKVPKQFIENGEIILNISSQAVRDLKISNNTLEFRASFSGIAYIISVPIKSILAIYAQENQQGMFFEMEEDNLDDQESIETASETVSEKDKQNGKRSSHLRLIE